MAFPLALLLVTTAACGGDDDDDDGDGDGTAIDASPGAIDASPGEVDGSPDDTDAGNVKLCGGLTGQMCEETEYCDYEDDSCGNSDGAGACLAIPDACEPGGPPVCGCDGASYDNKCEAARAGVDVAEFSICKVTATGSRR